MQAQEWVNAKLKELQVPQPSDLFMKGEEFSGVLFAKYESAAAAGQATAAFARARPTIGASTVWCKFDRPLEVRVPRSFLLGL